MSSVNEKARNYWIDFVDACYNSLQMIIQGKKNKIVTELLIITLFFAVFGYWKFNRVLVNPEMCLTNSGDGIGGLGNIFTLKQEADEKGLHVLFGDTFSSEKVGFGLAAPLPFSVYWKWNFWTLSHVFSPENVYDFNGLLAFVLIGVFGFILLREISGSVLLSLAGALMLTHMDNFFARIHGHLIGLGSYYLPILLVWGAVRAGKNPTFPRLLALAVLNALNFLGNEYYGYYGLFFSYALLFCYFLRDMKKNDLQTKKFALHLFASVLAFVALMCLCYPNMVFAKIASLIAPEGSSVSAIHNEGHSWGNFLYYSVRKPLALFSSSLPWLRELTIGAPFKNDLGEFTFRIGLVLPLFTMAALIFLGCTYAFRQSSEGLGRILGCAVWVSPVALMFLFGVNPDHFVSLVPVTYKIAPMFRVAARAFLYVDIALIVLFVYMAGTFAGLALRNIKGTGSIGTRVLGALLLLVVIGAAVFGIKDVAGDRVLKKVRVRKLPDMSVYQSLRGKAQGLVLELPVYSPIAHPPEYNYMYFYGRTKHGFPMVNTSYPPPTNVVFREHLHKLSQYLNSISWQTILDLKMTGVRYLVVNKTEIDGSILRRSPHVKLIADSKSKSIFEMNIDNAFNTKNFLEHFIYSEPTLIFKGDFHDHEQKAESYWRWSGRRGEIVLKNNSKYNKKAEFSAVFYSPVGSTLQITSPLFHDTINMKTAHTEYRRELDFKAKSSVKMTITSDAPPYNAPDSGLVFCMYNYKVQTIE